MTLEGKRVVVIGGASGIGFAVAELARARGGIVVIASSSEARVNSAVARVAGSTGRTVDLRDEAGVAHFFDALGPFDHLVLTAGDWTRSTFISVRDLDLMQARDALAVRFWGALAAVKYGSRSIARDGSITLTGGMLAHRPAKNAPLPTAVGAAIEYLARGLARDLAPVRVNAVSPGLVLTEPVLAMPEAVRQAMVDPLPLARAALPAETAQAYIYLMLSTYVTGQVLPVDGGGLLV